MAANTTPVIHRQVSFALTTPALWCGEWKRRIERV
jgi:hypothetical protein